MAKANNTDLQNKIFQTVADNLKAQGHDVNFNLVEKVCKTQFEFLKYVIRFGEQESLRMKYLGNFGVKRFRGAFEMEKYLTKAQREVYNSLPLKDKALYLEELHKEFRERTKFTFSKLYRPVICYNKKGLEIARYNTLKEASEILNIKPISIYISCSKGTGTKRGLKFKFVEEIVDKEQENTTNS